LTEGGTRTSTNDDNQVFGLLIIAKLPFSKRKKRKEENEIGKEQKKLPWNGQTVYGIQLPMTAPGPVRSGPFIYGT
jgi:hypothetical protein